MQFQTAERKQISVVMSLAGKSGSGKTYSALILAKGMLGSTEDVFVIDTERGRASLYADDPRVKGYKVAELHPPFTSQSFVEAIGFAYQQGAKCIIIDSASHEWSGIGGCLEQVDEIVAERGQKMRMPAWGKVKAAHRRFVNLIAAPPCHMILCLRAKDKMEEVKNPATGKAEWVKLDAPVAEQQADFVFEMTAAAMIDGEHRANWTKVPEPLKKVLKPGVISEDQGEAIGEWVAGGTVFNRVAALHLSKLREASYEGGTAAMSAYWGEHITGKIDKDALDELNGHMDELKRLAAQQDEIIAGRAALASNDDDDGPSSNGVSANPFQDNHTPARIS